MADFYVIWTGERDDDHFEGRAEYSFEAGGVLVVDGADGMRTCWAPETWSRVEDRTFVKSAPSAPLSVPADEEPPVLNMGF